MQTVKTAYFKGNINWFVSFIDSSTPEERQGLADEIHEVYTRMESKGGKRLMRNLENRARCGAEKKAYLGRTRSKQIKKHSIKESVTHGERICHQDRKVICKTKLSR